ncbi:hypothetical protein [Kangiella sediminilitoris]|uniref:Lipoprotein n=1 Tax=Kangiella sediminilitoris TaxID=1144748 RepID=A0A1B3B954_9GAMM|nr:hypothetical protein [Kangiella sediminilitoris]AOE49332.1 hypothetical protein KS2013_608 [Kangiella sediminilitoris]
MILRLIIPALPLLLVSCSSLESVENKIKPETNVYLGENNVLHYDGRINKGANLRIFSLYQSLKTKPTMLKITSKGGPVLEGIKLGHWVYDNKLDVTVGKGCASSCANYIFPAGRNKYLQKDSMLIWHGNSYQSDFDDLVRKGEPRAVKVREKENAFYRKINVHPLLAEYGHKEFTVWNFLYRYFKETVGFDYSLDDMKKFNITNVKLIDGAWEWRKYNSNYHVIRVEVEENDLEPFSS